MHGTKCTTPITSYYHSSRRVTVKANGIAEVLHHAMPFNFHINGIPTMEVSARSLLVGGAMAVLCSSICMNNIHMMGRWHSDYMMRYLHIQAAPILNTYTTTRLNDGNYAFLPNETIPIIDVYDDENRQHPNRQHSSKLTQ
jgi:hypothetical protein